MPSIRIIAFATLILALALAVVAFADEKVGEDPEGPLLVLFVAAANAGAVAKLANVRHVGVASAALWLILLGAVLAAAAASCSYWIGVVYPSDGSFFGNFNQALLWAFLVERLFWSSFAALTAGWMLWSAAWLVMRRRSGRVVSRLRRPI